jgi:hypothetical protein
MTAGLSLLPSINSGAVLIPRALGGPDSLARLGVAVDSPNILIEQTAVAATFTYEEVRGYPSDQFILTWDDIQWPSAPFARGDVILGHYASTLLRSKLWLHGGSRGLPCVSAATAEHLSAIAPSCSPARRLRA